jgi:16S rRNA (adenine1518-N6/adenine1519-N6)-dimethyltransferase
MRITQTAPPNHRPRKRFGQNFLHDPGVIRRLLAAVSAQPDQHLVEIGPGQGALSAGLLETAGMLDLIELDRDLIGPLAQRLGLAGHASHGQANAGDAPLEREGPPRLRLHNADALDFALCALIPREEPATRQSETIPPALPAREQPAAVASARLRLVGNLPYNISTPLLFRFIEQAACLEDMHLMLQKEVVERITAEPGSKVYGRLSVMVQTYCAAQRLFVIAPGAFRPAPKVESAIVRLRPHRPLPSPIADPAEHARLVAAAFAQRRKTLRNSLSGVLPAERIAALGIDPGARAETLSVADFATLANGADPCIDRQIP